MDRFSVQLPAEADEHGKTYEFLACDAQAMLDWLKHEAGASGTHLYRNGQQSVQIIQMGHGCCQYWMILPACRS